MKQTIQKSVTYRVRFYDEPGFSFGFSMGRYVGVSDISRADNGEQGNQIWDLTVPVEQAGELEKSLNSWKGCRVSTWLKLDEIPEEWR